MTYIKVLKMDNNQTKRFLQLRTNDYMVDEMSADLMEETKMILTDLMIEWIGTGHMEDEADLMEGTEITAVEILKMNISQTEVIRSMAKNSGIDLLEEMECDLTIEEIEVDHLKGEAEKDHILDDLDPLEGVDNMTALTTEMTYIKVLKMDNN